MLPLLNKTTPFLRVFLEKELSNISSDWWNSLVFRNLTEQQQRNVRQKKVMSLDGLDLAALLRVFDANYFDIQNSVEFPRETRGWLKELQQVRNRWAHQTGAEARADDLFRDLDTIERFLGAIGGGSDDYLRNSDSEKSGLAKHCKTCDRCVPTITGNLSYGVGSGDMKA